MPMAGSTVATQFIGFGRKHHCEFIFTILSFPLNVKITQLAKSTHDTN